MTSELTEMAKTIAKQEEQIERLTKDVERWKKESKEEREIKDKYYTEIKNLKKQLELENDPESKRMLQEAHKILLADNQKMHSRYDAVFGAASIDCAGRKNLLRSIIERLDAIKATIEVEANMNDRH